MESIKTYNNRTTKEFVKHLIDKELDRDVFEDIVVPFEENWDNKLKLTSDLNFKYKFVQYVVDIVDVDCYNNEEAHENYLLKESMWGMRDDCIYIKIPFWVALDSEILERIFGFKGWGNFINECKSGCESSGITPKDFNTRGLERFNYEMTYYGCLPPDHSASKVYDEVKNEVISNSRDFIIARFHYYIKVYRQLKAFGGNPKLTDVVGCVDLAMAFFDNYTKGLTVDDFKKFENFLHQFYDGDQILLDEVIGLFYDKKAEIEPRCFTEDQLFINKKVWNTFTDSELEDYKDAVFHYYRNKGFPHFEIDLGKFKSMRDRISIMDTTTLIDGDVIKQNMNGLNVVNAYMPHMQSVKSNGFKSPMDCFNDDVSLRNAVHKRVSFGDNISDAGMRKVLSWSQGSQRVSNFRPTVAKYIYDTYAGDGDIIDFSSGYGGRLLGAICSHKVKSYTGFDPCLKTYHGLLEIEEDLNTDKEIFLLNEGYEDARLQENAFDLAFSSPPYFNTEEYDYDDTQSFIKYPTKEKWRDGFLTDIIDNSYRFIKDDGYFIINVANVKTYPELEEDCVRISKEAGFKYIKTYKMALSSLMKKGFKYEPIFVFQK